MRRIVFFILVLGFLSTANGQNVGEPAPDFNFNTLENGQISLAQHQGKVIYMFMFGYS